MQYEAFWIGVGVGAFGLYLIWAVHIWIQIFRDRKMNKLHAAMSRHPSNTDGHVKTMPAIDIPLGPHRRA
jgi:hypothetical protein